jgi:hypothetical protein
MRIRSIKPEFFRDEVTGLMDPAQALFYLGLCGVCDDAGRFEWNVLLIRADLDPYDAKWGGVDGIKRQLAGLVTLHRIVPYTVNGRRYGWMPSFGGHQKPNRPSPSKVPAPPPEVVAEHEKARALMADAAGALNEEVEREIEDSLSAHGGLTEDSLLERRGVGGEKEGRGSSAPKKPARPAKTPSAFSAAQARIVAVYLEVRGEPYVWQGGKDGDALKRLLASNPTLDAIEVRWRSGLAHEDKWHRVSTVAQLVSKWNDLTPKVDPHESALKALRDRRESELNGPEDGGGAGDRDGESGAAGPRPAPEAGARLSAAVDQLLGPGWATGGVQDRAGVEHGAERGGSAAAGAVRKPGAHAR